MVEEIPENHTEKSEAPERLEALCLPGPHSIKEAVSQIPAFRNLRKVRTVQMTRKCHRYPNPHPPLSFALLEPGPRPDLAHLQNSSVSLL